MKSVSNAYKASMKAMLRNRSYVRITFGNVDTTAATDGEWESNGAASISEFETVDYAYQYGDTYAALELNRWALDGKTLIVNLPGSPKAVQENLEYILPSLEHGVRIAAGLDGECARK